MIKLAAFDIDGTLFDERRGEFPASAVEALRQLHHKGILIVIATGRPPQSTQTLREAEIFPDYFVCSNGHLVIGRDGAVLLEESFSEELAEAVWNYCRPRKIGLLWKYTDCTAVCRGDPEFDLIFSKNKKQPLDVRYDAAMHLRRRPNGGCLACSVDELARFNEAFNGQCRAVDINGRSSDLLLWGVTKQTGFVNLLERIGISPAECIAFGDNLNDLEMLRFAAIGVSMGNGDPLLKAVSDYVTETVDQDGIFRGLKHFHLI